MPTFGQFLGDLWQ